MAKPKLKPIPWTKKGSRNRNKAVRTVKMLRPRCDTCSENGYGWWESCLHDPYHNTTVEPTRTPVVEVNEDGEEVVTGWNEKNRYFRRPNVAEVPLHIRISSGMGVERALAMGYKFPQDVKPDQDHDGYAPMCEFRGCYEPNPKITSTHENLRENPFVPSERQVAHLCSVNEAKELAFKDRGRTREVYDKDRRAKQLQEMTL